jgi:hypothetical protein
MVGRRTVWVDGRQWINVFRLTVAGPLIECVTALMNKVIELPD